MSDAAALLLRVAGEDRTALQSLYKLQSVRLFGVAMAILRDRDAAAAGKFPPAVRASAIRLVNAIYARYFPKDPPTRIFICVPAWFASFDIEMDCIAAN